MDTVDFDYKIKDLRKTIESSRTMWRRVLDSNEKKWQEQLAAKDRMITTLTGKMDSLNTGWQKKYREKEGALADLGEEHAKLQGNLKKLQDQLSIKDQQVESQKSEIGIRQKDFEAKLDEKETGLKELSARTVSLDEEVKILKGRLADEQRRWDEVLQMKEKDFKVLQRELEKKAKDWEGQYEEDEKEIQIVRGGRRKLEQQMEELNSRLRSQELRAAEQAERKDDQIAALKRELGLQEKAHKEQLDEKKGEVEILRRQMEEALNEMTGKLAPAGGSTAPDEEVTSVETGESRSGEPQPALQAQESPPDEPKPKKKRGFFG